MIPTKWDRGDAINKRDTLVLIILIIHTFVRPFTNRSAAPEATSRYFEVSTGPIRWAYLELLQ